jgi:hypothetical protein
MVLTRSESKAGISERLMAWQQIALAVAVAAIAGSFTDWFFTGVLFHDRYQEYPEIWRKRSTEAGTITWSMILGLLTCAAFVAACCVFNLHGTGSAMALAGICWIMAPLPLTIMNSLYIKVHPLVATAHSLGWLAKLAVAAIAAGLLIK